MKITSKRIIPYCYYLVLYLLLLSTWARKDILPMPLRITFMALVFLPLAAKKVSFYFPCLTLFLITSLLSFAGCTFLPTDIIIYILLTVVFVTFSPIKQSLSSFPYHIFIILFFLTLLVNMLTSYNVEKITYTLLLIVLLPLTITRADKDTVVKLLPMMFIVATFACAVMTLFNMQLMIYSSYNYERLMSASLNYTCCTMGIGFVLALRECLNPSAKILFKVFYIISMMVIFFVILTEASRGAMLAITAASIIILLYHTKGSLGTKIIIFAIIVIFIFLLYANQYFDFFITRVQDDDGTGSNRTEIWIYKLTKYSIDMTPASLLWGIGANNTWNLGSKFVGCHNDYIAFLMEYGVLGTLLFFTMVLYPFLSNGCKAVRTKTLPLLIYILVVCFTLEPFSMGYLPFYILLLYMYLEAINNLKTS